MEHSISLTEAQSAHRPHSLIHSQRFWQKVASANGVAAWGYAYEGGEFHRTSSFVDISTMSEYGLTQKLSNSIRCF